MPYATALYVVQIYMYNSESRTTREISLNSSLEAIYVHHMLADTTYKIQMSAVTRKGEGLLSQLIVIGLVIYHAVDVVWLCVISIYRRIYVWRMKNKQMQNT